MRITQRGVLPPITGNEFEINLLQTADLVNTAALDGVITTIQESVVTNVSAGQMFFARWDCKFTPSAALNARIFMQQVGTAAVSWLGFNGPIEQFDTATLELHQCNLFAFGKFETAGTFMLRCRAEPTGGNMTFAPTSSRVGTLVI